MQEAELADNDVRTVSQGSTLICVRKRGGRLYAHADNCAHGRGSLSKGDIEDLGECEGGKRGSDGVIRGGACVRCPRHQGKFGGGLYFSMEDGASYVKNLTAHYTEDYRIDVYSTKVDGGAIYVSNAPKSGTKAGWDPPPPAYRAKENR